MKYKKKTRTVTRRRVRRTKRAKVNYNGNLAIVRGTSLSTINGCVVDGSYLTKAQNNLCFVTTNTGGVVNYGSMSMVFRLVDIWNYTELTVLYDSYTIDKVVISLIPYATVVSSGAAVVNSVGQSALIMHYIKDYDDYTLPSNSEAGVNDLRERKDYKSVNLFSRTGKPIKIAIKPRIASDVYAGGLNSAPIGNKPFGWIDCDDPNAEGYGFKAIFETITSGATFNIFFKAEAKYYLRFKNSR